MFSTACPYFLFTIEFKNDVIDGAPVRKS